LDNTVGIGFNVRVYKNFFLQQKAGVGVHLIIPSGVESEKVNTYIGFNNLKWEFIGLLNIGLVFAL
jgi:hypothetical protein